MEPSALNRDKPKDKRPRLRFPEFEARPGWASTPLRTVLEEHGIKSDGASEVHSVSFVKGIVPQIEHLGRSFAASNTSHYNLVRPFDIVYTRSPLASFPLGIVKQYKGKRNAIVSPLYGVFTPKNRYLGLLIEAYFNSPSRSLRFLDPIAQKGAKNTIQLSNDRFLSGRLFLPSDEDEQRNIAELFRSLDVLIAAAEKKLDAVKNHKQGLMHMLFPQPGETSPKLRFPAFRGGSAWDQAVVGDLVHTVTPPMKITTANYLADGRFPVVDQSPRESCGWTNDEEAVIFEPLPVIVFGDHTCTLKLVDRPFAQGADGIKILQVTPRVATEYLYHYLNCRPVKSGEYKRHYSDLKEKEVFLPAADSGEQQEIAGCLSSLDYLIAGECRRLEVLQIHKQGLLQSLLCDGELQ